MASGVAEGGTAWVKRKERIGVLDPAWPLRDIRMQRKPGLQPTLALPRISHRRGDEVLLSVSLSHALRQRVSLVLPLYHVSSARAPGRLSFVPDDVWISKPSQISVMKWTRSPLQRNVIMIV